MPCVQKLCCPEALSRKPEQMVWVSQAGWRAARWWGVTPSHTSPVSWVSAPGGQGHSPGGCWQVCSPDDISSQYWSFYSSRGPAHSGELGLGLHVLEFAVIWGWWLKGWRKEGNRDKGSRQTTVHWDWLFMTDVSSGESGVNTLSLHSCYCLQYPSLVTLFAPVEHLEGWHRSAPMWLLRSQMAQFEMAWTILE